MSRMPTGMYIPGNSVIHRADSRTKLLCFILLVVMVVCTKTLIGYAAAFAVTTAVIILSGLPVKTAVSSALRLYAFFIVIFLMNACFFSTENAWFSFWIIHPSPAGVMQGINVVMRVFFVLIISNVLTCTTAPMELTKALESLFAPLGYIGIPTAQIAMIISVAIQFIPTLFEETDMIRKAQTARGARFDSKRLDHKAGAVMPLVVPIFLGAFRRADELASAMEARGYCGQSSVKKSFSRLKAGDFAAMTACAAMCAFQIVVL